MTTAGLRVRLLVAAGATLVAVSCATPTPSASPSSDATTVSSASATPEGSQAPPISAAPTGTSEPMPELSLEPPPGTDERVVTVNVDPQLRPDSDGRIVIAVASGSDTRIDELVLRWPTALAEEAFLAPFAPSDDRIREGGPPLVQPWTKWVIGPGEQGEPDGTTSVGWGPLMPGATLTIPIAVTRTGGGPVSFDLQVLAGNDLLTLDDGRPADVRVELP